MPSKPRPSDKIRETAAKLGYVAPISASAVPYEVRAKLAEQFGVSRQLVISALSREIGSRPGPKSLASRGKTRKVLATVEVVRWLRALALERLPKTASILLEVANGIELGHVDSWTDPVTGAPLRKNP